jgi:hypothetical protein
MGVNVTPDSFPTVAFTTRLRGGRGPLAMFEAGGDRRWAGSPRGLRRGESTAVSAEEEIRARAGDRGAALKDRSPHLVDTRKALSPRGGAGADIVNDVRAAA